MTICICNDLAQLMADFPELALYGDLSRSKLINRSGGHTVYKANKSIKFLTSTDGLDAIAEKPYITLTSYEEIFGLAAVLDEEGNEIEPAVAGDPAMLAEYKAVWDYETADAEGNYPSRFFYVPFGYTTGHLA